MKTCTKCGESKDESEFYVKRDNRKGWVGTHAACKKCLSGSNVRRVQGAKETRNEYIRRYMQEVKSGTRERASYTLIMEAKAKPCTDCGGTFPPECMDFDHLPEHGKAYNVSQMVWFNVERVRQELAKCEVVCANCHRIRTARRAREKAIP